MVVATLQNNYSKNEDMRAMLTQIRSLEAAHNMKIIATHIPGKLNTVADTLSRVILQDNLRVNPYYI